MILHHGDHSVLNVLLVGLQAVVHVLLKGLAQALDDQVGVADLLAVELHKGQKAALRAKLGVVSHILKTKNK